MAYERKSWREKLLDENPAHGMIFKILMPRPTDVDALMRKVPKGRLVTDEQIRDRLAKDAGADKTCSKVTGIFIRIAAEAAEEERQEGKAEGDITPYWRTVAKDGALKPKFPGGERNQKRLLEKEGHKVTKKGKAYFVKDFEKRLMEL